MKESSYKAKSIEELTFTDDGMFQAVLHKPEICAELIERLLNVRVNHVEYPELEKEIAPYYTTKSIRLDVYLKDEDKVIDVECQSYPQDALGKRTRYYQSMIDVDSLMKGQDYSKLKESYILFICKNDPFKDENDKHYALPCYTFKNICLENSSVDLNDKSVKLIYNASAYREEKNQKIRDFLHFIYTNEPGKDDFSNRLLTLVEQIKQNEQFKEAYAAMNLHDRDLTRMAERRGAQQKAIEAASEFLKENISPEIIAKCVKLPLEQIKQLQMQLKG